MRPLFTLAALLVVAQWAFCQQHDKYWMGQVSGEYATILMGFEGGGNISYQAAADSTPISITLSNVAMANANGQLQFYTNGNSVATWDHGIMQSGKGFNQGSEYSDFGIIGADTVYNVPYFPYAFQVIPDSYDANTYYMVHSLVVFDPEGDCTGVIVPKMQLSKLDMSANGGKGRVVYKNHYFDEAPMGSVFTMVRQWEGLVDHPPEPRWTVLPFSPSTQGHCCADDAERDNST